MATNQERRENRVRFATALILRAVKGKCVIPQLAKEDGFSAEYYYSVLRKTKLLDEYKKLNLRRLKTGDISSPPTPRKVSKKSEAVKKKMQGVVHYCINNNMNLKKACIELNLAYQSTLQSIKSHNLWGQYTSAFPTKNKVTQKVLHRARGILNDVYMYKKTYNFLAIKANLNSSTYRSILNRAGLLQEYHELVLKIKTEAYEK